MRLNLESFAGAVHLKDWIRDPSDGCSYLIGQGVVSIIPAKALVDFRPGPAARRCCRARSSSLRYVVAIVAGEGGRTTCNRRAPRPPEASTNRSATLKPI